jgi:hypothetical protein
MKSIAPVLLVVLGVSALATQAPGGGISDGDVRPATDANIITAIDDSSSMTHLKRTLAYTGLSMAVRDAQFLARVASGPHNRVGFMAFTWSSDGKIEVIVPWMIVANTKDAEVASAMFLKAGEISPSKQFTVRKTDVALAIAAAAAIERTSPFFANHAFINICSDGTSNSGAAPRAVRDSTLGEDMTISAVLFDSRPMLADYYVQNVVGGRGAFILRVNDAVAMSKVLIKKFWLDLTS